MIKRNNAIAASFVRPKQIIVLALVVNLLCSVQTVFAKAKYAIQTATIISSPDGQVTFQLVIQNGSLSYFVKYRKMPVIETSALGLTVNGMVLGTNPTIGKIEKYAANEKYAYRGVHSMALNRYKAARVSINAEKPFVLDVRVFNNGAAFRYVVNQTGAATIEKESTEFVIPIGCTVWSQNNVKYYEGRYTKKQIEDFKIGDLAGPPVTIQLPGNNGYAAITEAGLTDFAGASLIVSKSRTFQTNLSGITKKTGNFESPWRVIQVGNSLNMLVNSDIIANVSPAFDTKLFPKGYGTEWVKPGRSVWSWLASPRAITLDNMKHFSDLAAQLGFEYNLVDEGWSNWKDGTRDNWAMMKELVDYSASKGVKIWVWKAYPDRGGIAGIKDPKDRKAFFQKCKDLGIVGMKVDFFDSENQEVINFYQAALKDAAEYHLMMDFHGANKPTGESRTWPNEMTREAIRGMENRPPWAVGNTTLPFTRYLAGHADFTPIHFGDRMGEVSWAHHVASLAVFTSPFLCFGADPQSVLDNPSLSMIKSIPPTWDETIVLPQSKIGDLVLYARRKDSTWFLAAMSGTQEAKTVNVPLSFLGKGKYTLNGLKDVAGKQASIEKFIESAKSTSVIKVELNPEGGFIARFDKIER